MNFVGRRVWLDIFNGVYTQWIKERSDSIVYC
jgi:hypothetical protein